MKLLIVTHDVVAARMAGPAIRCWELARALAPHLSVTLTSQHPVERAHPDFTVTSFEHDNALLVEQAKEADILLVQGLMLSAHPRLAGLGKHLVVDLYDPFVFESYPYFALAGDRRDATYLEVLGVLDTQMRLGDYFLCANDRQRDLYLGRFCALGRLTPALFAKDAAMTSLVDVVPFGLPSEPPTASKPAMRGVLPGVTDEDFLLLWGGGVWNWFDALSVIRAVAALGDTHPHVKLVFMGLQHPNPEIPAMAMAASAVALASELGVKDRRVFFNPGWVSYDERQGYLLEADAGVSAHFDSVETRFSFRTRVLDYLWAGLPVLTTEGDGMAELVAQEGLGAVVGYGDVAGWVDAIRGLADDPGRAAVRARVRAAARRFEWQDVAKPLLAYCRAPYRTPKGVLPGAGQPPRELTLVEKTWQVLRYQGAAELARRARVFVEKRRARRARQAR